MNVSDLLPTPGKVPGESIDPILQTWRIKKNFDDNWSQWVDFIEELWPRGQWHWQIKKNFSDTSYNRLQRLTTVLQMLATICGKISSQRILNMFKISLRQEKLFATIKLSPNLFATFYEP